MSRPLRRLQRKRKLLRNRQSKAGCGTVHAYTTYKVIAGVCHEQSSERFWCRGCSFSCWHCLGSKHAFGSTILRKTLATNTVDRKGRLRSRYRCRGFHAACHQYTVAYGRRGSVQIARRVLPCCGRSEAERGFLDQD